MKRRYKLLVIIFISFLLVTIIYYIRPKEQLYVAIGSRLNSNSSTYDYISYINMNSNYNNYSYKYVNIKPLLVNSLLSSLEHNKSNLNEYIKRAKLITICMGTDELYNYKIIDNEIIDDYLNNLEKIFNIINKTTRGKVVYINAYNYKNYLTNKKIEFLANKYDIKYISVTKDNNYYQIYNETYLNNAGSKQLASEILGK